MAEPYYTPYRVTWRDRIGHRLANTAMSLCTREYRAFVRFCTIKGTEAIEAELVTVCDNPDHAMFKHVRDATCGPKGGR